MDGKRVTKPNIIRRRHSDEFKRALVQRSLAPGASVAAIAQEAGINANLLFNWRRLHLQAQTLAAVDAARPILLPVTVVDQGPSSEPPPSQSPPLPKRPAAAGTIEIDINGTRIRIRGPVDEASLRTVLRALTCTA